MEQVAEYFEPNARVVAYRDGDDLVFSSDYDDNGKSIVTSSRMPIADYVAKGEGSWPWYDLGYRRGGALQLLDALGVGPTAWIEPLPSDTIELFDRARDGRASIAQLLTAGADPDTVDRCGASPLWYAVRSLDPAAALVLISAGADAQRRIELSARGEVFTTILHEMVRLGRLDAVRLALARGVDPSVLDSAGATPLHSLDDKSDHVYPDIIRTLVAAGADVNAATTNGERPVEAAARRVLSSTVTAMLELGADPAHALDGLLRWWVANVRWAAYRTPDVAGLVAILRSAGALVGPEHHELASTAGVAAVSDALSAP